MPFLEQGAFRLYYEDTGGDKPALLFLHGAGGNHLSWWQQVPAFMDEYRCLTVDQRTFGQSPDVPDGPGCTALAGDASALLDHLHIERCALVAQSMGGWAAVGVALQTPQRFWAIVLANTVGHLTDPEITALRRQLASSRPARPAIAWQGALGGTYQKRNPAGTFLYAQIAGLSAPRTAEFRQQLHQLTTPIESYRATGIPTFFITSDEDMLIWPEIVEHVHAKIPGATLLRVPQAGHSTYFEQPEVFNQAVAAFLQTHRPAKDSSR